MAVFVSRARAAGKQAEATPVNRELWPPIAGGVAHARSRPRFLIGVAQRQLSAGAGKRYPPHSHVLDFTLGPVADDIHLIWIRQKT